jgi:hypothetical protein
MLKELWLDPCWNQCNSGVERAEGRETDPVPWLHDKSIGLIPKKKKMTIKKKRRRPRMVRNSPNTRIELAMVLTGKSQVMKSIIRITSGLGPLGLETVMKTKFGPGAIQFIPKDCTTAKINPWMLCCDSFTRWLPKILKMEGRARPCSFTSVPSGDYRKRKGTNTCDQPDTHRFF